jgi:hypothetical protein
MNLLTLRGAAISFDTLPHAKHLALSSRSGTNSKVVASQYGQRNSMAKTSRLTLANPRGAH